MEMSEQGLIELTGLEGLCVRPYKDSVGVWTVGIGHTASQSPDPSKMDPQAYLTVKECIDMLKSDILKYTTPLNKALTTEVSQTQFDALTSWCYNIGVGGMQKSSVIKYINGGMSNDMIASAFMMWSHPSEIINRRRKEVKLFLSGQYSEGGKALQTDTDGHGHELMSKSKIINVADILNS